MPCLYILLLLTKICWNIALVKKNVYSCHFCPISKTLKLDFKFLEERERPSAHSKLTDEFGFALLFAEL